MMSCSKEPSEGGSGEAENFSVAFEVSDVTASSAVISFSPSSQTLPYIAGYVSSSDLGPSDIKYFIDGNSNIRRSCTFGITSREVSGDKNLCSSKEEAEAFLALMQLRQLRKAWIGDWEQKKIGTAAVIAYNLNEDKIIVDYGTTCMSRPLSFPTQLMAYDFLGCFKDLCKTAKILL